MNTKLTLTIQKDIIVQAKEYAKSHGRSLSDIIENYLKGLTRGEAKSSSEYTPVTDSLIGSFKEPEVEYGANMDYKEELQNRREKKYLNK